MNIRTKIFSLVVGVSFAAVHPQQTADKRERPVQVASAITMLAGLKTMASSLPPSLRSVAVFPVGGALVAGGFFGIVSTKSLLKSTDKWHDIGCEVYYWDRVKRLGFNCPPADAMRYTGYVTANKMNGYKVPQWIQDIQKELHKK